MSEAESLGGRIGDPTPEQEAQQARSGRVHLIDIEKLIIHKYPEPAALLRKADKLSRDIIHNELREGEVLRVSRPGRYHLLLPKLLPAAGALRTSVIAEQLFRAIGDLNPAKKSLDDERGPSDTKSDAAASTSSMKRIPAAPLVKRSVVIPKANAADEEMRRAANNAIAMMSNDIRTKAEELFTSPQAKSLLDDLSAKFEPVWNTRKSVVGGYRVVLTGCAEHATAMDMAVTYGLESTDATNAVLDAIRYKYGSTALESLANNGEQAIMVVPVAFSTIDHSRYIGAFLDAGGKQTQFSGPSRVVFEFTDVSGSLSRYRLREAAAYLRARCRSIKVCLGADWATANLKQYREFGVNAVGLDLGALSMGEVRVMKTLEGFAEKAEKAGLGSFCKNINKFSVLTCAVTAGVHYVSGQAVVPPLNAVHGVAPLDMARLVSMTKRKWMEAVT